MAGVAVDRRFHLECDQYLPASTGASAADRSGPGGVGCAWPDDWRRSTGVVRPRHHRSNEIDAADRRRGGHGLLWTANLFRRDARSFSARSGERDLLAGAAYATRIRYH